MKAVAVPSLEDRIRDIRTEIDAVINAKVKAVAKETPGVPSGVIRNLLIARAPTCACAQYLEMRASEENVETRESKELKE